MLGAWKLANPSEMVGLRVVEVLTEQTDSVAIFEERFEFLLRMLKLLGESLFSLLLNETTRARIGNK
jgi:hypothetical protein